MGGLCTEAGCKGRFHRVRWKKALVIVGIRYVARKLVQAQSGPYDDFSDGSSASNARIHQKSRY